MQEQLYQPFSKMRFDDDHCFLSGEKLSTNDLPLSVFAPWLTQKYNLQERPFKLLDESMLNYADIKIPASSQTTEALIALESIIEKAFTAGYKEVLKLDEIHIFQWVAKTVYGVIFKEIKTAIKQQAASGEGFHMSQGLIHKFNNLHTMLQSLIKPVELDGFKPWSIFICPVENAENEFAYRDEINTLTFSLRMQDFGLIMCLQDNGANKKYHEEVWVKVEGKTLHSIQFEELCAKIFYSAYLFNRLPEYHIIPTAEQIFIEAMPLRGMTSKPVFDEWQNKTYGQVLENFWKKWGFLLLEIIKNPNQPMSFLFDKDGTFNSSENIKLEK